MLLSLWAETRKSLKKMYYMYKDACVFVILPCNIYSSHHANIEKGDIQWGKIKLALFRVSGRKRRTANGRFSR